MADDIPAWWQPFAEHHPWWHAWLAVNGLYYARLPGTSPPWVVTSKDPSGLSDEITKREAGRERDSMAIPEIKPYEVRLTALRELEKYLAELAVPTYMIFDFPQQASSWDNDPWQPVLLAGDVKDIRPVKYLHRSGDKWFYAVDSWLNDRGSEPGPVAGELALWWAERNPAGM